ncbi:MAG: response regulator [bacterium]
MTDSKIQILIVEDDPLMSRLYSKVFSIEGYEVSVAIDGEEGLLAVHKSKPTVILLDVMMPKMNGLELLEKLKSDPETKKIPVIMLTNLAGEADAEKAITLGAVKYIVKSEYEPKAIVNMVKEILAGYTRDSLPSAKV